MHVGQTPEYSVKRYVVLTAAVLVQACLGGVYAWSAFAVSLGEQHAMSAAQTAAVFGVAILTFTIAMLAAGRVQARRGARTSTFIGGLLLGSGYILASFSEGSFAVVLVGVGLLGGIGIGFGYLGPLATGVKWFPNHKGLVTGISVAGFGGGAIVLARIIEGLAGAGYDVLEIFRIVGVSYGLLIMALAMLLMRPVRTAGVPRTPRLKAGPLLRQPAIWPLIAGMFAGTFAGMLVIGNMQPIGQAAGLEEGAAALTISFFALGNVLGRIVWGHFYDRVGRSVLPASLVLLAGCLLLMAAGGLGVVGLYGACLGVGFGFGACFVLYAAHIAAQFGPHAVVAVYPWIFLSYGLSGLLGPVLGGYLYDLRASYTFAIVLAAAVALGGAAAVGLCNPAMRPVEVLRNRDVQRAR